MNYRTDIIRNRTTLEWDIWWRWCSAPECSVRDSSPSTHGGAHSEHSTTLNLSNSDRTPWLLGGPSHQPYLKLFWILVICVQILYDHSGSAPSRYKGGTEYSGLERSRYWSPLRYFNRATVMKPKTCRFPGTIPTLGIEKRHLHCPFYPNAHDIGWEFSIQSFLLKII